MVSLENRLPRSSARILHVMASGARGGGSDHLLGLLPAQRQLGLDVCAAVGNDGPLQERLQALGIPTIGLALMQSRWRPQAAQQIVRAVSAFQPDFVHTHGTRAAFFAGFDVLWQNLRRRWSTDLRPLPYRVYTAHGLAFSEHRKGYKKQAFRWAEAWNCRFQDGVISVSQNDLHVLQKAHFLRHCPSIHIRNAVDTTRFYPRSRQQARERLGLKAPIWIGTTSRLVAQKAVGDLLDAVAALDAHIHVLIIGDGPQASMLKQHSLAQAGRVLFLGARDDVAEILPALDVFALSSHWEGEPIALLEALASGVPCVATQTAGSIEILQPTACGVTVPIGKPKELAHALRDVLADEKGRQDMRQAGLDAMQSRNYAAQAEQVAQFYARVAQTG